MEKLKTEERRELEKILEKLQEIMRVKVDDVEVIINNE